MVLKVSLSHIILSPLYMSFKEGTLAAYSMFRGFLNSMENEEENKSSCAKLSMCEAAR